MATRNAQVVCDDVEQTIQQMRLFQRLLDSTSTTTSSSSFNVQACLHWDDIAIGKLLGHGAFCQVHEVTLRIHNSNDNSSQEAQDKAPILPMVLKHLRKDIVMKSARVYQQAAADLVIESKILACLSHPNIIQIRGSATSGTHGHRMELMETDFS